VRGVLLDHLTGKPQGSTRVPNWSERNAWVARIERQVAEQRTREMLALAGAPGGRDLVNLLYSPGMPSFRFTTSNQAAPGLQPGTLITPAQNAYSTYATILNEASITEDCYAILVWVTGIAVAAANKNSLTKIGIDQAGGTSPVDFIPHLLTSGASFPNSAATAPMGVMYYFPVFIPGGSELYAAGSVDNATVGNQRVYVRLFGRPTNREMLWYGHGVDSFGAVTATSEGTVVVPGNAVKGSFVQLGSNTAKPYYWWQLGVGSSDTAILNNLHFFDLAAGSSTTVNDLIVQDETFSTGTGENWNKMLHWNYFRPVPSGVGIYGRAASSSAPDTDVTMAAYGVW